MFHQQQLKKPQKLANWFPLFFLPVDLVWSSQKSDSHSLPVSRWDRKKEDIVTNSQIKQLFTFQIVSLKSRSYSRNTNPCHFTSWLNIDWHSVFLKLVIVSSFISLNREIFWIYLLRLRSRITHWYLIFLGAKL